MLPTPSNLELIYHCASIHSLLPAGLHRLQDVLSCPSYDRTVYVLRSDLSVLSISRCATGFTFVIIPTPWVISSSEQLVMHLDPVTAPYSSPYILRAVAPYVHLYARFLLGSL